MNLYKKNILIVDDENAQAEFFEVMLSKLGFTVAKADNGVTALEKMQYFTPDLIMLDNLMPRMSGWELTKILKKDPKFREISIIMLSALDDVKDKIESFELGVDDYITKPFKFSEVVARIRAILRSRELLTQIAARESRLHLAETLNADMKQTMADCIKSIDELNAVITDTADAAEAGRLLGRLQEKTRMVKTHILDLDARIEKTIAEWESLKKNEIGLAALKEEMHQK